MAVIFEKYKGMFNSVKWDKVSVIPDLIEIGTDDVPEYIFMDMSNIEDIPNHERYSHLQGYQRNFVPAGLNDLGEDQQVDGETYFKKHWYDRNVEAVWRRNAEDYASSMKFYSNAIKARFNNF